jgi:Tfp pilus assembly protein PilN
MLNLLPQTEKKKLINVYRVRFSVVIGIAVSVLFLIAIIGLMPSYLTERSKTNLFMKEQEEASQKNTEALLQEAEAKTAANTALAHYLQVRITTLTSAPVVSSIISRIFDRTEGTIAISAVDIGGKVITVRGVARTRTDLIAFHQRLRQDADFKNATLPISDIAKSINPPFSIVITLP